MKSQTITRIELTEKEFNTLKEAACLIDDITSCLDNWTRTFDKGVICMEFLGAIVDNQLDKNIEVSVQNLA